MEVARRTTLCYFFENSLFSAILIPQFFLQWFALENYGLAFIYGVIIVLYVVIFVMFGVNYWRYKNNVK